MIRWAHPIQLKARYMPFQSAKSTFCDILIKCANKLPSDFICISFAILASGFACFIYRHSTLRTESFWLCFVLYDSVVKLPFSCTTTHCITILSFLPESTLNLRGLISWLHEVQRVLGEKYTDRWHSPVNGHFGTASFLTLPHLPNTFIAQFSQLVESTHFPLHYLDTGDGFGDSSAWPGEHHLPQADLFAVSFFALHPRHCEAHQVADLAAFFHSHLQDAWEQPWKWAWAILLCPTDPLKASRKTLLQDWAVGGQGRRCRGVSSSRLSREG